MGDAENENGQGDSNSAVRMSSGLYISCPHNIKSALHIALNGGYHFIVTQIIHPGFARICGKDKTPLQIGRTDRILQCGTEWGKLIVAEISPTLNVDSEIEHVQREHKAKLEQELGFATHLGVPAIQISLTRSVNTNLARIVYDKLINTYLCSVWVLIPMVHPSRFSQICTSQEKEDTWDWWNNFRTLCRYDKRLGLILELSDVKHIPPPEEIDRWLGEPVRALLIPTSLFILNNHGKPVLARVHQEIIKKFMRINVQYVIKSNIDGDVWIYNKYLSFLGRKLSKDRDELNSAFRGMEDFLQNPLQPLSEHLDTNVYEVFEKDEIKYTTYQLAIERALENLPTSITTPVVMVVGSGRGPLVQAVINASIKHDKTIKLIAVEKNPYAVNTLLDRVEHEWGNLVTVVNEDMRVYNPEEKADIIVSELLGSFGDNELSPECLDGAQRFLKKNGGISIPAAYTSYIAPIQSSKLFNEIQNNRPLDKSLLSVFETPYVVHLVNRYQIAEPKSLFKFTHPNWDKFHTNERFKRLRFNCTQDCVLNGFVGYFDTVLYQDVTLSIVPETHTHCMGSWFPIVFPIPEPVHIKCGNVIQVVFWRVESNDKVWYEWCLESPVKTGIINPNGRSYFIKKII